jgi:hypothetical protein
MAIYFDEKNVVEKKVRIPCQMRWVCDSSCRLPSSKDRDEHSRGVVHVDYCVEGVEGVEDAPVDAVGVVDAVDAVGAVGVPVGAGVVHREVGHEVELLVARDRAPSLDYETESVGSWSLVDDGFAVFVQKTMALFDCNILADMGPGSTWSFSMDFDSCWRPRVLHRRSCRTKHRLNREAIQASDRPDADDAELDEEELSRVVKSLDPARMGCRLGLQHHPRCCQDQETRTPLLRRSDLCLGV